jgi:hypothetical protein
MLHFLFAPCGVRFSHLRNQKYPVDLCLFAVCRCVSTSLIVILLLGALQSTRAQLPAGIGWTALPSNTSLEGSGACPPNNFEGDPFLFAEFCQNVIRTWNGAIADTAENRLIIWGGGHVNYYGNEIYSLNLTANPITLTRVKDPTVPTNYANSQNCIESIPPGTTGFAPNSREDYGGLAFIPSANVMYILNGSLACGNGYGSLATWTIPLNNLSNSTSWVYENPSMTGPQPGVFPQLGGSSYGNIAVYDPNTDLVFVSDSSALFTYNYHTNTYTRITAVEGFVTSIYLSGAIDPVRKLFVAVGGCAGGSCGPGDGVFVADISNPTTTMQNWTAATLADHNCAQFLSGGSNPISASNPGIVYDSVANDFVGWPNQGNGVYIMTPDTANHRLTCQVLTFANGPPNSSHANNTPNTSYGTFGRFQYFPALDAFVLVNDWNIPPYILRLRSSTSPDFTLSAMPSSASVTPGGTATYTVSAVALNGFSGDVSLGVSGLPAYATASFSSTSIAPGGTPSTLTVTTTSSTPSGSLTLTITGTSGVLTHSVTVVLSVSDFTLSVGPSSASVTPGGTATYTVSETALNGFTGTVNLSVSGLPAGATSSLNPTAITGSGSSTLTVQTSSKTPAGSATLTIAGKSGSLTQSTTTTLVVKLKKKR